MTAILCLCLAAITAAVYWPVHGNAYINYDDPVYVTDNPHVQSGINRESLLWALTTGYANNWHPVTWFSHMLDWSLFSGNPGSAHLVSAALHGANAALLFLVLSALTRQVWRSWVVAALFAFHPIHVESVAWIAERKDVLSTLFFFLTVGAYVRYTKGTGGRKWTSYGFSLFFFLLALMSKPMVVTAPFVLLLLDYWPLGRMSFNQAKSLAIPIKSLIIEKVPFLVLSLTSSVLTYLVQQRGGAVSESVSLGGRLGNAFIAYAVYLKKTVWPLDLAVFYPHPGNWPWPEVLLAGLVFAGITVFVVRGASNRPYLAVGWLWYIGMLVPVIGLVQVGMQSMADRYTYVPIIGIFIALIWFAAETWRERRWPVWILQAAAAVSLLACAAFTLRQLVFWRNSETLFTHAISVTTDNFLAYNNLGAAYGAQGALEKELECYRRSLEIKPNFLEALNNLASAMATEGRFAEAVTYYEKALQRAPEKAELRLNLANALAGLGELDRAIPHYEFALSKNPANLEVLNQFAVAFAKKSRWAEALVLLKKAATTVPNDVRTRANLANVFALRGDYEQAVQQYKVALGITPADPQLHYNLANVLTRLNRTAEAADHYREALRLRPDFPEAARRLQSAGRPQE